MRQTKTDLVENSGQQKIIRSKDRILVSPAGAGAGAGAGRRYWSRCVRVAGAISGHVRSWKGCLFSFYTLPLVVAVVLFFVLIFP